MQSFIGEFSGRNGKDVKGVSQDALALLEQYHWPGNVRELRNVIERATILAPGEFIEAAQLPPNSRYRRPAPASGIRSRSRPERPWTRPRCA